MIPKQRIPQSNKRKLSSHSGSVSSSMAEQESSRSQPPNEWQTRRSKLAWRSLLIFNLAVGAYYIFSRSRKKETGVANHRKASEREVKQSEAEEEVPTTHTETTPIYNYNVSTIYGSQTTPPPAVKPQEPITEDQQRELFKWMLEEKRKVKPKDPEEKKRVDEDKAILKQFIRAKSIPRF